MRCRTSLNVYSFFFLLLILSWDGTWASPLSFEKYRFSIQQALSRIEAGKGPLEPEASAFLEEQFPRRLEVDTKSGDPVTVDNGPLLLWVKQAQETEQGRESLIAHFKALGSQISFAEEPIPLSEDGWEGSRARLGKVFSGKEFQGLEEWKEPAWMVFLKDIFEKVWEWLLRHSQKVNVFGRWIEYVFYGGMLAGIFLLVLWIVRSFGPVGWRFRDPKIKTDLERKGSRMDWKALRGESRHKGEEGAFREAIRLFFISVLMEGHERGWWVYRREATNREHLSGVEGSPARREAMGKMIQLYENVWYGHESSGKEDLMQCAQWLRLMEAS